MLVGDEWLPSYLSHSMPRQEPWYPMDVPVSWLRCIVERKIFCPSQDSNPGSPSPLCAHYSNYTIPAPYFFVCNVFKLIKSILHLYMVHNLDVTFLCILFMVRDVTSFHDVTGRVMSGFVILTQSTETAIMLIHYAV